MKFITRLWFVGCLPFAGIAELQVDVIEVPDQVVDGPSSVENPEASGHQAPPPPKEDVLTFFNGNALSGDLQSLDEAGVSWSHKDSPASIRFSPENLKRISLITDSEKQEELSGYPRIELTNGDAVRGELKKLGPETLTISSPALGKVDIPRHMIRSIENQQGEGLLYQGPSQGEWSFKDHRGSDRSWRWVDNTLIAESGNMSAFFEPKDLPDQITIHFHLEWRGSLNLSFGFWGLENENPSYNSFMMALQDHYIRIHRNFQKHGHENITSQQIQPPLKAGKLDLKLHLDKETKTMVLYVNEELIGQWRDAGTFPIRGDQFTFHNQSNSPVRVSSIQIETWDGKIDSNHQPRAESLDEMITVSGDSLTGTVKRIEKKVLIFDSEFAELKIPLDRLQTLLFASSRMVEPEPMDQTLQLFSVNDDRITIHVQALEQGEVAGTTTTLGPLTFQTDYLKTLILNPEDARHEQESWAWD